MPTPLDYQPGTPLRGLAVDRRHTIRLPGWDIVELQIHPGRTPAVPERIAPMSPDDEDWTIERLEIVDR